MRLDILFHLLRSFSVNPTKITLYLHCSCYFIVRPDFSRLNYHNQLYQCLDIEMGRPFKLASQSLERRNIKPRIIIEKIAIVEGSDTELICSLISSTGEKLLNAKPIP